MEERADLVLRTRELGSDRFLLVCSCWRQPELEINVLSAVGMAHCVDSGQEAYPVISAYFLGSSAMLRVPIGYVVICVVLSFELGSRIELLQASAGTAPLMPLHRHSITSFLTADDPCVAP